MRLFLAIDPPTDVKQGLAEHSAGVRASLPKARWVRVETLHLTLAFLGEVPAELVPKIDEAMGPVFHACSPMTARIGAGGAFPPRGRARVLWAHFEAGGDLESLHRDAELALATLDVDGESLYEPEPRRFHPHVTLARCRRPWPRKVAERWMESFGDPDLTFELREGTLFESHLTPTGARYRAVSKYPFR